MQCDDLSDCGLQIACGELSRTTDCGLDPLDCKPKLPLRVMFIQTDMRVGGAEMLTANIIRRLDRRRFAPELCCLKERGELGETLCGEIPVHHDLLSGKYDLRVWLRLTTVSPR